MANNPQNATEYQIYLDFINGSEYKKLTEGEEAVFSNFNVESAQDLQQMRDYIYQEVSPSFRNIDFKDFESVSISRLQIGMALQARKDYREKIEKSMPKSRRLGFVATTKKSGYVGQIKSFDASQKVRC